MDEVIKFFLQPQNGILGVLVVVLMFIVGYQQKRLDKKDQAISDLQEKRKLDSDGYAKIYTDLAKESVAASKDNTNALNLMQRSLDSFANSFQSFLNGRK